MMFLGRNKWKILTAELAKTVWLQRRIILDLETQMEIRTEQLFSLIEDAGLLKDMPAESTEYFVNRFGRKERGSGGGHITCISDDDITEQYNQLWNSITDIIDEKEEFAG